MAKKFEYLGPETILKCRDCLYCQAGYDEEAHCYHPKNDEHSGDSLEGRQDDPIPDWCKLEDVDK